MMALYIMLATLVADELVAHGGRRLPAYTSAVVIGCAAGALVQWAMHRWLHVQTNNDFTNVLRDVQLSQIPMVFFEYLIWGSIIVFIYVNRRTALLAIARMNAAQVERAEAQRRTLESRLQALQARIEPEFLFNTLARVRNLHDRDPVAGSRMLGDLIVYLRAALPQLRESTSTLEQELKLVGSYLSILRASLGKPLRLEVDVSAGLAVRVPPMLLLPLIHDALIASRYDDALRITARVTGNSLSIELSDGANCVVRDGDVGVQDLAKRLRILYGERGIVAVESSPSLGARLTMEIPYEPSERGSLLSPAV
jgi:LytS/YehU family sensor histidine kinase